jgi:hypothetical protein
VPSPVGLEKINEDAHALGINAGHTGAALDPQNARKLWGRHCRVAGNRTLDYFGLRTAG